VIKERKSVALFIETSNAYARGLLHGIVEYVQHNSAWSIVLPEHQRGASLPGWLRKWRGDGVIARIETESIARALRGIDLPVVDVSAARHVRQIPWVETDDAAIAQLAAEHLMERGFRQMGYCGERGFNWSLWRQESFQRFVEEAGCTCHVHQSLSSLQKGYSWNREKQRLAAWVRELPKPIGVMACYDIKAQQLLDVCRELRIAVPEEVAVIGVDNDPLLCGLANPPLSSVIPNVRRTGYEAAVLLDRMMAGERVPAEAHLIKPLGVHTRQSTEVQAMDDPAVAAAVRFISEHACSGIDVTDVLRHTPLTRRELESRFQKVLNRTPHQEILRVRMTRVKRLLAETTLSLAEIAAQTGYQHVEYLSVAFKREVGQTPREFRRATNPSAGAPGSR